MIAYATNNKSFNRLSSIEGSAKAPPNPWEDSCPTAARAVEPCSNRSSYVLSNVSMIDSGGIAQGTSASDPSQFYGGVGDVEENRP